MISHRIFCFTGGGGGSSKAVDEAGSILVKREAMVHGEGERVSYEEA